MAEPLFFIDTNPDAEEEKETIKVAETLEQNVLGKEDSVEVEKRRKKKEKERNLAKFLFGSIVSEKEQDDAKDQPVVSDEEPKEEDLESSNEDSSEEEDLSEVDAAEEEEEDLEQEEASEEEDDEQEDAVILDNNEAIKSSGEEEEADQESSEEEEDASEDILPKDALAEALNFRRGRKRKAAWKDEADDSVLVKDVAANYKKAPGKHGSKEDSTEKYGKSVERKFRSLVGEPSWAKLDQDQDQDSDEEFFRENTDVLLKEKGGSIQKDYLSFTKLKDMNNETHNEGTVIRSSEFHPSSTVGLVTGLAGTASLFQIDGKNNPKIQTVNFKDFPVKTAKFSTDGNEVLAGSQYHSFFYVYDMIAGKIIKISPGKRVEQFNTQQFEVSPDGKLIAFKGRFGSVHLVSGRTKEYVGSLKMNAGCQALKFSKTGAQLYTHGEGGEVYVWDTGSRVCVNKFVDEGCISGSALAVNSGYLATGSSEGVVNLYNLARIQQSNPKPDKVILNLTTQINQLTFNPTGEILAMSSELKDSAVKLVHVPSRTVYSNFPGTFNTNKINSVAFSPGGGYMSLGNNKGAAFLYRIQHYKDY